MTKFKNLEHFRLFGVASSIFIVIVMTCCLKIKFVVQRSQYTLSARNVNEKSSAPKSNFWELFTNCVTSDIQTVCRCLPIIAIVWQVNVLDLDLLTWQTSATHKVYTNLR
ncbi:hypothetical protein AQUCO_09300052v1 [Aquilegia coerulea]|uniref:Uncharacterized protein n=1 Tax=Aquilegia coerulea TaxID=218851 RepID=A0A2G5C598_AQUCA|nr:hypothetical protein AQUCO_09300052v1 [Aquilegia coerulea]